MNKYKEKYIFQIYNFLEDYEYDSELLEVVNNVSNGLFELEEIFYHTDNLEYKHLQDTRLIIDTLKFHIERYLENEETL